MGGEHGWQEIIRLILTSKPSLLLKDTLDDAGACLRPEQSATMLKTTLADASSNPQLKANVIAKACSTPHLRTMLPNVCTRFACMLPNDVEHPANFLGFRARQKRRDFLPQRQCR